MEGTGTSIFIERCLSIAVMLEGLERPPKPRNNTIVEDIEGGSHSSIPKIVSDVTRGPSGYSTGVFYKQTNKQSSRCLEKAPIGAEECYRRCISGHALPGRLKAFNDPDFNWQSYLSAFAFGDVSRRTLAW
ncbi:uncharacterized protein LOC143146055 [Ptiloglossa arizonensis]|uniref:uncharacterized protein LOC143146055 n=1 Tax=Ptiloglossa arizonensis TaxID=3350558 RepID=UPI003F9F1E2B